MHRRSTTAGAVRGIALGLALILTALPAAAQDFRLPGLGGGSFSEADLSRGATIIVVWASWSPRSRDIVPRVNAIAERWGGRARVVTVVFQEEGDAVQRFLAGQDLRPPIYLDRDGEFSKKYSVATLPGLLIVRDGVVLDRGKLPDDPDPLIARHLG